MAGFLQRLFQLGKAEAHNVIDKLEDPVKITEQAIRDLKKDLENALKSFAEIKSVSIRSQRDIEKNRTEMQTWERKAMMLLQSAQQGKLETTKADRLASEALSAKEESKKRFILAQQNYDSQNANVQKLQENINQLRTTISKYENELLTLKARAKTATATKKINQQLSTIDSNGTVALLERMKQKVEEEESLAAAYSQINEQPKSIENEIDQALLNQPVENQSLKDLKAKMGIE